MKAYPFVENSSVLRSLKHELLLPVHWARWRLLPKSVREDRLLHAGRVRESPDFHLIPKHPDTGKLINRRLVMHNGLRVLPTAYHGYQFLARARLCETVDEPQEERLFADVLRHIHAGSNMLELGSLLIPSRGRRTALPWLASTTFASVNASLISRYFIRTFRGLRRRCWREPLRC